MNRREVSRRTVSTRVLGSANPVARWGRGSKSTCWDSIGGFFVGLFLFVVAFALPTCAARTEKVSKQVARLTVQAPSDVTNVSGLVLVSGPLEASGGLEAPRGDSSGVIAFRHTAADMETHLETRQETHTEVRNGQDVQVTEEITEEVTDWVEKINDQQFASGWNVGGLKIDPHKASLDLPWRTTYSQNDGKHREAVDVIVEGSTVLLAVELSSGQVASEPKLYRLTCKSQAELVAEMNAGEETGRWGMLIASVILWTISLNLLIGPAMILINVIPIQQIGGTLRGIITFCSFLIACTLSFFTYALVKYWWLVALVLVGLTVVVIANARGKVDPDMRPPEDPQLAEG